MPRRMIPFAEDEYYHVFNRGVARQPVFLNKRDYRRFITTLSYYRYQKPPVKLSRLFKLSVDRQSEILLSLGQNGKKLVDIVSFVLMPNHFHFLLQQNQPNGISFFIRQLINSYTKYFNTKNNRVGAVFQGTFKAVHIETDELLLHVSRYIHLNPLVSFVVREDDFLFYPWSSLKDYLSGKSNLINLSPVLGQFPNSEKYKEFVLNQKDYAMELERIKHLSFE